MAIKITCDCGQDFTVADEHAGKKGRCPQCGKVFTIPDPDIDMEQDDVLAGDDLLEPKTKKPETRNMAKIRGAGPRKPQRAPYKKTAGRTRHAPSRAGTRTGPRRSPRTAPRRGGYDREDRGRRMPAPNNNNILFFIISFIIPLAGLILGIIFVTKQHPEDKKTGWICFAGLGANVVFQIILIIIIIGAAAASTY